MGKGENSYLRFLNGCSDGFVEIVDEYRDGLVLFINSFLHDFHTSEEAADETFLKLYMDKPKFKSGYSFKTWLYTIGRNTALNYVKKQKRSRIASIEDYSYISDEADIEADYIKSEENIRLHRAIDGLKEEYAQVLYLIYFEDADTSEAARIMGKNNRQISNLIYRAKIALRAELGKENGCDEK